MVKLQWSLGILFHEVSASSALVLATARSPPNANEFSKLCSVISAYQLVDVLALLGGGSHTGTIEKGLFHVVNSKFRVSLLSLSFYII